VGVVACHTQPVILALLPSLPSPPPVTAGVRISFLFIQGCMYVRVYVCLLGVCVCVCVWMWMSRRLAPGPAA
jgi:hypothetical protein